MEPSASASHEGKQLWMLDFKCRIKVVRRHGIYLSVYLSKEMVRSLGLSPSDSTWVWLQPLQRGRLSIRPKRPDEQLAGELGVISPKGRLSLPVSVRKVTGFAAGVTVLLTLRPGPQIIVSAFDRAKFIAELERIVTAVSPPAKS